MVPGRPGSYCAAEPPGGTAKGGRAAVMVGPVRDAGLRAILRPLRAAVFAAVCVALTASGHELEGGHTVGLLACGVGFVVVFVGALLAGGRERPAIVIMAALFAGQAGLHLLFTRLDGPTPTDMPGMPGMPGMPVFDPGMLVMHLGIAVAAGWWLRRGEAACWRLLRRVESGTAAALRIVLDRLGRTVVVPDGDTARPRVPVRNGPGAGMTVLQARYTPRRGPPHG